MKVGFIDYYLDEWHANNYPAMLKEHSNGALEVTCAYGMIPSPISGKTSEEWCQEYGIELCRTIEEVIAKSDVLVVLSPDNCEMHETLAKLPLQSGKRTYIDKTFAPSKEAAQSIFAVAEENNTPCWSSSALRFAAEYQPLIDMTADAASLKGPNNFETYSIHQLEPMIMLMKGNVSRVMALPAKEGAHLLFEWIDGRMASLICTGGSAPFTADLCYGEENKHIQVNSDFFGAFIDALVCFFETGEVPVSHQETIEIMAVREAGLHALETPGKWIAVS